MREVRSELVRVTLSLAYRLSNRYTAVDLLTLRKRYTEAADRFNARALQIYEASLQTNRPLDRASYEYVFTSHNGPAGILREIVYTGKMDGTLADRILTMPPASWPKVFEQLHAYFPRAQHAELVRQFERHRRDRFAATASDMLRTPEALAMVRDPRTQHMLTPEQLARRIDAHKSGLRTQLDVQISRLRRPANMLGRLRHDAGEEISKIKQLMELQASVDEARTVDDLLEAEGRVKKAVESLQPKPHGSGIDQALERFGVSTWAVETDSLVGVLDGLYGKIDGVGIPKQRLNLFTRAEEHVLKLGLAYLELDASLRAFGNAFLVHHLNEPRSSSEVQWAYKANRAILDKAEKSLKNLKADEDVNAMRTQLEKDAHWGPRYRTDMKTAVDLVLKDYANATGQPEQRLRKQLNRSGLLPFQV